MSVQAPAIAIFRGMLNYSELTEEGHMRNLAILMSLALTACGTSQYGMYNASTGQEVVCRTPTYYIMPAELHIRVADECMRACRRHGFVRADGDSNIAVKPAEEVSISEDAKPYIPTACLP
jgi:hypothetical protein